MYDLILRSDPIINRNTIQSYYGTEEDGLDYGQANQRIAISILGNDFLPRYDQRYVRIVALI